MGAVMRFDKFTVKSQEPLQDAQSLAQKSGHQLLTIAANREFLLK